MSSQSDSINCNKIVALTNTSSKCNAFIFDAQLDISCVPDATWENVQCLLQTLSTTITGKIFHKYKQLKVCSWVIDESLYDKFPISKLSTPQDSKATFSVGGRYVDELSNSDYSEIIYDWFTYDGYMTIPESSEISLKTSHVYLQYTIRFLISPALPAAQCIYSARKYEKMSYSSHEWKKYEHIMNTKVDHEKEYNHLEIWQAVCTAYGPNK